MKRPILRPGDEFATRNPTIIGKLIRFAQKVKATDNEATYNHTGIITDPHGATLEALWTITAQNIWENYKSERILVVRNANMTLPTYAAGFNKIRKHIGQWYPVPRLFLHMIGMAKFIHWDRVVCSELTAKFETGCAEYREGKEAGFMRNWYGVNPDHLTDRWKISRYYHIIYEGVAE